MHFQAPLILIASEPFPDPSQMPVVAFGLQLVQIITVPSVALPGRLPDVVLFKIGEVIVGEVANTALPVPVTVVQSITPAVELFNR